MSNVIECGVVVLLTVTLKLSMPDSVNLDMVISAALVIDSVFGNTNVIRFHPILDGVITWIWLWQNYHAIHHLFTAIPFYNYKKVFISTKKELKELGMPVFDVPK